MTRKTLSVLGSPIDCIDSAAAVAQISAWAASRESRYVCICNAHSIVTAREDPAFREALAQADMSTPDGWPVAWMLRRLGATTQRRLSGPDLMLDYCASAAATGESIFLYGSTQTTLDALENRLKRHWPGLVIAGRYAPPFRPLTPQEDESAIAEINRSGAGTVWVSLGCPKQELWMASHRDRIHAVMIGVGAAFDFHAGTTKRAPQWMRDHALEWLHRLMSEPRRLWKRYLVTNTLFVVGAAKQLSSRE